MYIVHVHSEDRDEAENSTELRRSEQEMEEVFTTPVYGQYSHRDGASVPEMEEVSTTPVYGQYGHRDEAVNSKELRRSVPEKEKAFTTPVYSYRDEVSKLWWSVPTVNGQYGHRDTTWSGIKEFYIQSYSHRDEAENSTSP
uniref:Uncharacterized protein n=1 Tax=Cacopsylla melanoneura TaxID=428564 RepID=A0A8D8TXM6_9HEMI